ncbi:MAG: hypothetical protein LH609_19500, partial [Rudanella sp.]|nr:hypothetical protein [Rudanella sp.]
NTPPAPARAGPNNTGPRGGNSNAQVVNCVFLNNTATSFGGAAINDGGSGGTNDSRFTNCVFLNNAAPTGSGGAVYNFGGAGSSTPQLINCGFQGNIAGNGGAMYNDGSNAGVSNPQLTNCSFQSNSAANGGGLYNNGMGAGTSSPQLTNCLFFGNGGANTFVNNMAGGVSASYSFFDAAVTGYSSGPGNLTATLSPFVSATSVQLRNGSPAVNAGDPATTSATVGNTDLTGNPRFFANGGTPAGRIDMGAYELQEMPEIFTLKNGTWNDPNVWSVERLPQLNERVRLKHLVTIPASFLALSGILIFDPASKLIYTTGGRLQLGQ